MTSISFNKVRTEADTVVYSSALAFLIYFCSTVQHVSLSHYTRCLGG